ncbi:isoprenoid synthase domain-containing protein [Suillus paluster]|uniref:isoprenoid synthase domain-containing protein n=1 Tax=Suillus paluster TaxID=48578 RepID=UPI001B87451A|nr:isoprenoid synthase domain-containing protein [Suillus paluster]KAG1744552.1 isoprenoid synthase domain-containing protein [Suillus paluster]
MACRRTAVARAAEQWFFTEAHILEPEITKWKGLRVGESVATCYPDADAFHLRVCVDIIIWGFRLDDLLDEFDVNDTLQLRECCISVCQDPVDFQMEKNLCKYVQIPMHTSFRFMSRFRETSGTRCTERLIRSFDLILTAMVKEVEDRAKGCIHDFKSYIALRRDTVGGKMMLILVEYAAQIDLPDEVISHPVIMAMEEAVINHMSWTNYIYSYNKEQSCPDTHNLVTVLMHEKRLDLQGAVDYAGQPCKSAIQRFEDNRVNLPSWGKEIDRQVALYGQGLQNIIVGPLEWYLSSARYCMEDGRTVNRDRVVTLLPKRPL